MAASYQDLINALPALSADELATLKARASALLALGGGQPSGGPMNAGSGKSAAQRQRYALQIVMLFKERGQVVHLARIFNGVSLTEIDAKIDAIEEWLGAAGVLNLIERDAIVGIGLKALATNFAEINIPLTPRSIASNLHRVPALLEREFPGYAAAGLLRVLIRKKVPAHAHSS